MITLAEPQINLFLDACRVANFIQKHYPPAQNWDDPVGWAGFFLGRGFTGIILDENHEIAALAAARPVEKPEDGSVAYLYDETGDCLFVDLIVIPKPIPGAFLAFTIMAERRFPGKNRVAYFRKTESNLKVRDFDGFLETIRKIGENYGDT